MQLDPAKYAQSISEVLMNEEMEKLVQAIPARSQAFADQVHVVQSQFEKLDIQMVKAAGLKEITNLNEKISGVFKSKEMVDDAEIQGWTAQQKYIISRYPFLVGDPRFDRHNDEITQRIRRIQFYSKVFHHQLIFVFV